MAITSAPPSGPKSWVPRLPSTWVSRPRLLRLLDAGAEQAVTTVIGPPGVGKTALVAEWFAQRSDDARVWLTLDARDNDPARFVSLLTAALSGEGIWLPAAHDDIASLIDELLAASAGRQVLIVLDDAQELTNRRSWEALLRVAQGAPAVNAEAGVHLVVVTRADPPLGLQRLKLHGDLAELRAPDLVFDRDETARLLDQHGLSASATEVAALCDWAGGWIAALSLAMHAMRSSPDDGFLQHRDDTEAQLADFILQEALGRMPEDERRFVLRASVADVLTAELATALTGAVDADMRLRHLEHTGAFLLGADRTGGTFRFHGLMAALLRAQLKIEDHETVDSLARTASAWYACHGMLPEAEVHAIRGSDWATVAGIRTARFVATALSTGRASDELRDLPVGAVTSDAAFEPLLAAAAIERGDRSGATAHLSRVQSSPPDDATVLMLLVMLGCAFGSSEAARQASDSLIDLAMLRRASDPALVGFALLRGAELRVLDGDEEAARLLLARMAAAGGTPACLADAVELRTLLDVMLDARVPERRTEELCSGFGADARRIAGALTCALSGELVKARAQLALVNDQTLRSSRLLRSLHATISLTSTPSATPHPLDLPEPTWPACRALVTLGHLEYFDVDGAVAIAGSDAEVAVVRARRALVSGSPAEALESLSEMLDAPQGDIHPRTLMEAATMAAAAELQRGRESDALARLERALVLSDKTQVRAPLLAWGARIRPLLDRHLWELAGHQPSAVDLADQLRTPCLDGIVEPLTDREQAVLRHLPTLMSNAEIATEMLVSINTVKTHLKAIYRKLGVERRRDAVLRARRLGLL